MPVASLGLGRAHPVMGFLLSRPDCQQSIRIEILAELDLDEFL